MPHLHLLKTLLVAVAALSLLGGGSWALQMVTLNRPSAAQLELVKTLRALTGEGGSQATLVLDGHRYRSRCTQQWVGGQPVSRVVLDRRDIVTQVGGHLLGKDALVSSEFELAGCPRRLLAWLSSELVDGASVRFHSTRKDGTALDEIELHPRTLPVDLFVAGSSMLPVRLDLSASGVRGTSTLHYEAPG